MSCSFLSRICFTLLICSSISGLNAETVVQEIEPSGTGSRSPEAANALPGFADPNSFPEIVALVNEFPIQKQLFLERAASIQSDMGLPDGDLPLQIYRTILNEMVDMELLYQASQARNFRPELDEVERQYQALLARFPSEETFLNQLRSRQTTAKQFKELMYRDLSVQKLIAAEFAPRISVTDEAKLRFYSENKAAMAQPEQLRLSHILKRVDPGAPSTEREEARQKIRELREKVLRDGSDFAAIAREYSDDQESKDHGGEIVVKRGQTAPAFEEAAFRLEPGAISEIVDTQFGFHIIKLHERIPARVASYEEVESMIQEVLDQRELQSLIKAEVKELRGKATVKLFI